MADKTEISWCDSTFNPWIGCTKVGPGCDNCYAEADFDKRRHRAKWGPGQERSRTSPATWKQPLRWNKQPFVECMSCGWRGELREAEIVKNPPGFYPPVDSASMCPHCRRPMLKSSRRRVFCASLADVFDNEVPAEWRADLFQLIESTPNLDWLLLTKRIGNVPRMVEEATDLIDYGEGWQSMWGQGEWPRNVWIGATICNQNEADRDIPKLLAVPAAVRFLSIEPMLGPIDLTDLDWPDSRIVPKSYWINDFDMKESPPAPAINALTGERWQRFGEWKDRVTGIDWVIVGGESGPNARPMHPEWVRSLRDQCAAAGVPLLFKQWGEHDLSYDRDRDDPDCRRCNHMTKLPGRWINLAGGHGFNGERVHYAHRIGKKSAGRLLDGIQHNEFPVVSHG